MRKTMIGAAALAAAFSAPAAIANYADDRAEIENLTARYFIAMDARDSETYASLFTPDGVLEWAGGNETGREEIRKANAGWARPTLPPGATLRQRTQHYATNQLIEVNGNSAVQRAYWVAITNNTPQKDVQVLYFGRTIDTLQKIDGKWYFKKREIFNESAPNRRALFYPQFGETDPRTSR